MTYYICPFGPLGVSGGRNISAVHPKQSVQRKEGLWWPHSLDGVRTGIHWSQGFWQNHYSSCFRSANMNPPLFSLQFQDPEFGSLSGGRVVRIAVNPDYQGVRTWKRPPVFIQFLINLDVLYVTGFQSVHQMGYGSRALQLLQMYYEGKFPTMDESTHSKHNEITSVSSEVMQLKTDVVSCILKTRNSVTTVKMQD